MTPQMWYPRFWPSENNDNTGRAKEWHQRKKMALEVHGAGSDILLTQTPVEKTQKVLVATVSMRGVEAAEVHIDDDDDRK